MISILAFVKIVYFHQNVVNSPTRLTDYVIDYADYSTMPLEQMGLYRYRKIISCFIGKENPDEIIDNVLRCKNAICYYCNDKYFMKDVSQIKDIINELPNYALVMFECYM